LRRMGLGRSILVDEIGENGRNRREIENWSRCTADNSLFISYMSEFALI